MSKPLPPARGPKKVVQTYLGVGGAAVCQQCQTPRRPRRGARFCSATCRAIWWRARQHAAQREREAGLLALLAEAETTLGDLRHLVDTALGRLEGRRG
jgi:hypothetical protein